jgi:phytanoyl-CoA hydroxylase
MNLYKSLKEEYVKSGFCLVKSFFTKDEIEDLDETLKKFLDEKSHNLKGKDINKTKNNQVNTMHDIDKHEDYFKKFSQKKKILDLAAFLLESDAEFRKCEMFAKPAKVGMASPMHQDNYLWAIKNNNGLTFWVALDHCDQTNGGLTYITCSHTKGLLEHEDSFAPGTSQKIKKKILEDQLSNLKIVTPVLERGDVLIHHCLTVHGSNVNTSSQNRRGFTIQFKDKKSVYDEDLLKHYQNRLQAQLRLRNQI